MPDIDRLEELRATDQYLDSLLTNGDDLLVQIHAPRSRIRGNEREYNMLNYAHNSYRIAKHLLEKNEPLLAAPYFFATIKTLREVRSYTLADMLSRESAQLISQRKQPYLHSFNMGQ